MKSLHDKMSLLVSILLLSAFTGNHAYAQLGDCTATDDLYMYNWIHYYWPTAQQFCGPDYQGVVQELILPKDPSKIQFVGSLTVDCHGPYGVVTLAEDVVNAVNGGYCNH